MTSRLSRAGAGVALGCCLSVVDGVRCSKGAPVADALIRANAVDVLQEGKKIRSTPDKDQINNRQADGRQDWILR